MHGSRLFVSLAVAFTLVGTGCASAGSGSGSDSSSARSRGSRYVITAEQLAASHVSNLMDAIRRLRPDWLRVRGATSTASGASIVVYVDGIRVGGTEALGSMSIEGVVELRRLSPTDATTRWGTGHSAGAIEVIRRR